MSISSRQIRSAVLGFLAGAAIAGTAVFLTVSHLVRERERETFELYNSTIASARLTALLVLRDEGLGSGIALLENALLNDLRALESAGTREAAGRMVIDRIKTYQKLHPPAVYGEEENSAADNPLLPLRSTEADRARR